MRKSNFLFFTKPLDSMLGETEKAENKMVRALGPWQVTMIGIGATLGAGIFATVGTAAAGDAFRPGAGPALSISFALTAAICALVAICYSELASMIPISGSAYTYSYATLGEIVAWIIGWDLIIEYGVSAIAVAISWSSYFYAFLQGFGIQIPTWLTMNLGTAEGLVGPEKDALFAAAPELFGIPIVFNLPAFAIVAGITILLMWGITQTAKMNTFMVLVNIAALILFITAGLFWVKPENWVPFAPNGWAGISAGAAIVFFSYIGFDAVSTIAEETKNPQRSLPIGILSSLVIVSIFYVAVALVFSGLIPFDALKAKMSSQDAASPLVMALNYASPKLAWVSGVLAVGAVIATTAVLLVVILGQTRIFSVMARDGLLPSVFSKLHPKFRTPVWPTIITGGLVGFFAAVASLDVIIDLTNIGTLFAFILVCLGVIALRITDPGRVRKFRVPGGLPWAAGASVVLIAGAFMVPGPWTEKLPFLLIAIPLLWILNQFTLPLLGIAACGYLILNLPMTSILRFVAWLNIGLIIYCGYGVAHSKLQQSKSDQVGSAEHKTNMALMGALLAVIGVFLAIGVRALEIFEEFSVGQEPISKWQLLWERADSMLHYASWMNLSWFFIVPLVGNGLCLCPLLMWRLANKDAKTQIAALEKRRRLALAVTVLITLGTIGYLIAMFGHRLVS